MLETTDGRLDRFEHGELVVYGSSVGGWVGVSTAPGAVVVLDAEAIRGLIHALECALVPYGETELVPESAVTSTGDER